MSLLWQPFPMPARRRAQAWRYHPAFRRPAHFHDDSEFNLVVRGTATFVVGHRRVPMSAGSLVWYPPGVDHYLEHASDDLELYVVGFRPELLDAFARQHGVAPSFARPLHQVDERTLRACAETLAHAPEVSDDGAVEQRLLGLLAGLEVPRPPRGLGHRAASLLARAPELGRDDLVRRLASNRGDVSRRFRSEQGLSLTEYKNRLQVLRLIARIEAGQENLTRAAVEAGFGSYSRCHQVVRELLGCAPSALLDPELRRALHDRFEPIGAPRAGRPAF
ncbi:MAG TPA: AraC family ligand binding domain-containing protein [Polyangiaceae bacterium]|nr:AraC family ligand binding domain-containing protein [Polyangiaceae bacterium]